MEGLSQKQYNDLVEAIGKDAAAKIKAEMDSFSAKQKETVDAALKGVLTESQYKEFESALKASVEEVKSIAAKQGVSINELTAKLSTQEVGTKTIADQLKADYAELKKIYQTRSGVKEYMVSVNAKGEFVMKPFDSLKSAGPHATIDDVGDAAHDTSITQAFDSTTILRMGADAPIISNFRNTPWVFGLCNLTNVSFAEKFFQWFDEQTIVGGSSNVAEGGSKPVTQYKYELKSDKYKKEAMLLGFTEEFSLDFGRLQDDITNKARIDLINRINTAVIANIKTAGTAYNDSANFKVTDPNDYHVIAAMAAQVETNTFALMANTAVMNTRKKYLIGTITDQYGRWLNAPDVLNGMSYVSNPAVDVDDIMVGDFKQYNVALRGGIIVRIGYNGTDFAENRFSQVVEQYYFDYISTIRKAAIVKGPDFATVRTAIAA